MSVKHLLTAEQLWEMPDEGRYELAEGELIEVPGAGALHGFVAGTIYDYIKVFALEHGLGVVFGDGVSYILSRDPDTVRIPDASFVARSRIPESGLPEGYWPFAPDLAVEIVSPGDTFDELQAKVREYLAAGTRLVWVVWPRGRSVIAYHPGGIMELAADDLLSGGDVLPGFEMQVGRLFEQAY